MSDLAARPKKSLKWSNCLWNRSLSKLNISKNNDGFYCNYGVKFAKNGKTLILDNFLGRLIFTSDLLEITESVSAVYRFLLLSNLNKVDQKSLFCAIFDENIQKLKILAKKSCNQKNSAMLFYLKWKQ